MPTPEDERLVLQLVGQYGCGEHLSTLAERWAAFTRRRSRALIWTPSRDRLCVYPDEIARHREGFFIHNSMRLDYAWEPWFDRAAYREDKPGGWRTIATGSGSMIQDQAQRCVNAGGPYGGPEASYPCALDFEPVRGHHSIRGRANSPNGLSYYRWCPDHWTEELTLTVWPHGCIRLDVHENAADALEFIRDFDEYVDPRKGEIKAPLGGQPVGLITYWRHTNGVCFIAECANVPHRKNFLLCPITPKLVAIFVYEAWYPKLVLHRVIPTPVGLIERLGSAEQGYAVNQRELDTQTSELLAPLHAISATRILGEAGPDPRPEFIPLEPFGLAARDGEKKTRPRPPDAVPYALWSQLYKVCGLSGLSGAIAQLHFQYVPTRIPAGTKGRVVANQLWCAILRSSAEGKPRLEGTWKRWVRALVREGYLAKMPSERAVQSALRELKSLTPVFEQVKGKGNGQWIVHRDKLREMPADFLVAIKAAEAAYVD